MSERLDTESMPLTEPHWPPTFDTGPHPEPLAPLAADPEAELPDLFAPTSEGWDDDQTPASEVNSNAPKAYEADAEADGTGPAPAPVTVAVPRAVAATQFQYVKRWKFALLLVGVWIVAAAAGVGMYYWWFHSMDKTWPDFAVLMYVIACMLAALLVSLVENRPMVSMTSIAVVSAPFASAAATAVMYGMYVFGWIAP